MTCKIHLATDGEGRPLGLVLTAGQAAATSFFQAVLETISVAGNSRGRPRIRPDRVLADKAYTSGANRSYLAGRGINVQAPQPTQGAGHTVGQQALVALPSSPSSYPSELSQRNMS
ncbi:transposase [Arthrobacter sp. ISL-28]|nr:transposase [Arthrobacter sp. ISL-28]